MNLSTTRIARTALALFGAALLLPVAQASARPDTGEDVGPIVLLERQAAVPTQALPSHVQDLVALNAQHQASQTAAGRDNHGVTSSPTVASVGTGFDWGDAGIGALATFSAALLLCGGIVAVTRARRAGKVAF